MTITENRAELSTEARIEIMLLSLSIPPHLKGFRYLARAIALTLEDESCLQNIMVQLYGCIAEEFGVTAYSVERDARTALHQIPPELCREVLGAPDRRRDKPITVRALVALCLFRLKYPD